MPDLQIANLPKVTPPIALPRGWEARFFEDDHGRGCMVIFDGKNHVVIDASGLSRADLRKACVYAVKCLRAHGQGLLAPYSQETH